MAYQQTHHDVAAQQLLLLVRQALENAKTMIRVASDAIGVEIDELGLIESEAVICRLLRGETLDLGGVFNPELWRPAPPVE